MSRVLGIDCGTHRVGLALSDPTEMLATPLSVSPAPSAIADIVRICAEKGVARIVVGLPLNMNGSEGPAVKAARAFADKLRTKLGLPIEFCDERLTTVTAQNALIEGGARRDKRKEVVDMLAAQIMLQHYLDRRAPPLEHDIEDEYAR